MSEVTLKLTSLGGRGKRVPPETILLAVRRLHALGWIDRRICARLDLCETTVRKYRQAQGLAPHRRRTRAEAERDDSFGRLRRESCSLAAAREGWPGQARCRSQALVLSALEAGPKTQRQLAQALAASACERTVEWAREELQAAGLVRWTGQKGPGPSRAERLYALSPGVRRHHPAQDGRLLA